MSVKVYEVVNARIVEQLEKGVVPWRRPWRRGNTAKNMISGREYNGLNRWLLNSLGYERNYFLTYKQATELGGKVNKGEHGYPIIFWKWLSYKDKDADPGEVSSADKQIPFLRYFTVFHFSQCEGIPEEKIPAASFEPLDFNPVPECEKLVSGYHNGPPITHSGDRAFYSPLPDRVTMPPVEFFVSIPEYYAVLFHELAHSTGHTSRLKRNIELNPKGGRAYAQEELTAEFTSSFLCAVAGIDKPILENQAAYIQGWLSAFKKAENAKVLVMAAGAAEKAANWVIEGPGSAQGVADPFRSAAAA